MEVIFTKEVLKRAGKRMRGYGGEGKPPLRK